MVKKKLNANLKNLEKIKSKERNLKQNLVTEQNCQFILEEKKRISEISCY